MARGCWSAGGIRTRRPMTTGRSRASCPAAEDSRPRAPTPNLGSLGGGALAIALVVVAACTVERADVRTVSGEPPEADTIRVRRTIEAFARGWETGDLSALDSVVHDSLTVFDGAEIDRGWRAYREGHLASELGSREGRRFVVSDVRPRLAGSTAWVTFTYERSALRGDRPVELAGTGTAVLQKLGGRWRIVHLHTSAPPAPEGS